MGGSSGTGPTTRMLATPVGSAAVRHRPDDLDRRPADCSSTGIFLVIVLFGAAARAAGRPARVPARVLTGLAFAAPIMAFSATQRTDSAFNVLFRFGITPLFLFSGTFFPIEQLPSVLQPLAWLTPLYHGVAARPGRSRIGDADPVGDDRSTSAYLLALAIVRHRGLPRSPSVGRWSGDR